MRVPGAGMIAFFIRRPMPAVLVAVGVALFGLAALLLLPVAWLPESEYPVINVEAGFPGASAETMATAVAAPLERRLATVAGLEQMSSTNSVGRTAIRMRFTLGRSIDGAGADVQSAIASAAGDLPRDMPSPPTWLKENPADRPVVVLAFTSATMTPAKVNHHVDTLIVRRIANLPGVSRARVANEQKYAVRINVNPWALAARGLSTEDVRTAVERASVNRPKGKIEGRSSTLTLATNDQLFEPADFRGIVVARRSDGGIITLADVATVTDGVENDEIYGWFNGKPGIMIGVRKRLGANIVQTADNVMRSLETLKATLPPAIDLHVVTERAESIRTSLSEVRLTLAVTIVLVVLVIYLFLGSVPATLIPAATIPLSLLATFAAMYVLGFSIDNISLMALIVAVGFVVDDAIVVVENIYRYLEAGLSGEEAAIKGAGEVSFTVVSISLALIAVFVPIFFMGGVVGRLFQEFAAVVSIAILASAGIALTLTPMMCSRLLKAKPAQAGSWTAAIGRRLAAAQDALAHAYSAGLERVMRRRTLSTLALAAIWAATVFLYVSIPKGFFPPQDNGRMFASAVAPPGTPFAQTKQLVERMTPVLRSDPDIASVTSYADGGNAGSFNINLKPRSERDSDMQAVMARLKEKAATMEGLKLFLRAEPEIVTGTNPGRNEYLYILTNSDRAELETWAPIMEARLKAVPGLADVSLEREESTPAAGITVDREVAARLGIDARLVDEILYDAFGNRRVAQIFTDANQYYAIMGMAPEHRADLSALDAIYIPDGEGRQVPLSVVSRIDKARSSTAITHHGQFPSETISFGLEPGVSIGEAVERIREMERKLERPQGLQVALEGAAKEFEQSLASQPWLIAAALLIVYIVLGILYEDALHPLTILSSLPAAGAGALLALKLAGLSLDVMGLIGIILLLGIVMKNAILIVDFAIHSERSGKSSEEAVTAACLTRFRPIVMTSVVATLGALPLVLSGGVGAEMRFPLGIAIVGGLVVGQALALYSTPVVFLQLRRLSGAVARIGRPLVSRPPAPARPTQ